MTPPPKLDGAQATREIMRQCPTPIVLLSAHARQGGRETLLALLPLGLGILWTVGLMYFLNLKFNLGNVFGLPLILGADKKRLSKRHGATSVTEYERQGYLAPAMVNFLALLGWSPGGDREIMTLEEMVGLFSLDGIQKKPAVFDTTKLEWMHGQYLSAASADELYDIVEQIQARLAETGEIGEYDQQMPPRKVQEKIA